MWQYHSGSDKLSLISEDFTPLVNLCRFFEQKEIKKYFFLKYFSFLSFWEIKRNFRKYFFISEKERNIWISNLNISQRKKEIEIFFSRPRKKEIFRNPKRKFLAKPWSKRTCWMALNFIEDHIAVLFCYTLLVKLTGTITSWRKHTGVDCIFSDFISGP